MQREGAADLPRQRLWSSVGGIDLKRIVHLAMNEIHLAPRLPDQPVAPGHFAALEFRQGTVHAYSEDIEPVQHLRPIRPQIILQHHFIGDDADALSRESSDHPCVRLEHRQPERPMVETNQAPIVGIEEEPVGVVVQFARQHRKGIIYAQPQMRRVEHFLQDAGNAGLSSRRAAIDEDDGQAWADQSFGNVTPRWPIYLPARSA